ncbi:hypothetical protein AB9K26_09145 [Psychroserpens sp. XS_ASV72]|uniref:hypothetical protein n=1 Tax=Psychroserpens sp. XS_ASV72 TaxID=3241293 RepID=UPI003515EADE
MESISFLGLEINDYGFPDLIHLVYFLKMKILIIIFSIIWYLSCNYWWKASILVIITIELFKFITSLNSNLFYFDEIDFLVSLPFTIPIILLLFLFSAKINIYRKSNKLRYVIDNEIDEVFARLSRLDKNKLETFKAKFKELKNNKNKLNNDVYLKKLIEIRNSFYDNF